ncbi:MAG TPA: ornithine cyclodeaminase family protein [Ktedonobacterales bacterium]|jgi:ornithine cyclodeaminase/alanine dehydrogenase-like protein (mu-crystallin family)
MALVLKEADVEHLLRMPDAIAALETVFRQQHPTAGEQQALNRPRGRLQPSGAILHFMPAAAPGLGVYGFKAYTVARPGVARFVVMLFSTEDGRLLAQIEADRLGQMRTGAASGLATRYLARQDAATVGMVGSGWQARSQLQAVCAVRSVQVIRAAGRDPARLRAFCEEMSAALGVPVTPVADADAAVRDADIVITATNAKEPVVLGDWLKPGAHLNVMGSNWANRREVDERAIERSDLIVIDSKEQGMLEAGDLLTPIQQGLLSWDRVQELHEVVAGAIPGRQRAEEITLFKSLGLALEDIAVAEHIYKLARERGVGEELEFLS